MSLKGIIFLALIAFIAVFAMKAYAATLRTFENNRAKGEGAADAPSSGQSASPSQPAPPQS